MSASAKSARVSKESGEVRKRPRWMPRRGAGQRGIDRVRRHCLVESRLAMACASARANRMGHSIAFVVGAVALECLILLAGAQQPLPNLEPPSPSLLQPSCFLAANDGQARRNSTLPTSTW